MARFYDPDDERLVWELGPETWIDDDDDFGDSPAGTLERPEQLPDDWDAPGDSWEPADEEFEAEFGDDLADRTSHEE